MKEAKLYSRLENGEVQCYACAHRCRISEGRYGICRVRRNMNSVLYSLVYGKAIAVHVDPIEKKPLFHMLPGSMSFSMATMGCNMHCLNCQNSDISQIAAENSRIAGSEIMPEDLVRMASGRGCQSVSYTYTEPAVFWDYAYDTAGLCREKGIKNIFVTNGYWSEEGLQEMMPRMDAANVDLKFFDDRLYRKFCGARLKPVLDTIRRMQEAGVWIEITTLVIPGLNDEEEHLSRIADFIADLDPDIPWHVSRFYPTYRMMDRRATPVTTLERARQAGKNAGLRYVYTGNVPGNEGESTYCPQCGTRVIRRYGFQIIENQITDGHCASCRAAIAGRWAG